MTHEHRTNGIVIGVVSSLEDKENLGRVTVRFPYFGEQESNLARLATLMAGKGFGSYFVPEVGDEVLVAFEQGDPRRPYILGAVWNKPDPPPKTDGNQKENNWRFIQSRSGHIILLDDTAGKERIVLIDKDAKRQVVIDSGNNKIQVLCDLGDVEIKAPTGSVTIEAKTITLKATADLNLSGTVTTKIEGGTVTIN
jgi:uncharacterized protein involved in type VI secretion and phage assembly